MDILLVILIILNVNLTGVLILKPRKAEFDTSQLERDNKELTEKLVKTEAKVEFLAKKIDGLTPVISDEFRKSRTELNQNFEKIQTSNEKKLEQVRETVDEKLQASVEKRFNESFKQISGQLSQVYQGLGEMKNLATGVGDLKKVMEGVKTRDLRRGAARSDY